MSGFLRFLAAMALFSVIFCAQSNGPTSVYQLNYERPQVSFTTITTEVVESDTVVFAELTLSNSYYLDVTVPIVYSGSATAGEDYSSFTSSVRFTAGDTLEKIRLAVLNDTISESDETIVLRFGPDMQWDEGEQAYTVFSIKNSVTRPDIAFVAIGQNANEDDHDTVSIALALQTYCSQQIEIMGFEIESDAAPFEYTVIDTFPLTIPVGELSTSFRVAVSDDSINEDRESIRFRLRDSLLINAAISGQKNEFALTIEESDPLSSHIIAVSATSTYDQNASDAGSAWYKAFHDPARAIESARSGDTVWVSGYFFNMTSEISVSSDVTIIGGFAGDEMSLGQKRHIVSFFDGAQQADNMLNCSGDNVSVFGIVFTNTIGHAVTVSGDNALLEQCVFKNNNAAVNSAFGDGAAVFVEGLNSAVKRCVFYGNKTAGEGSALRIERGGIELENTVICNNDGPAIVNKSRGSKPTRIRSCTIVNNKNERAFDSLPGGIHSNSNIVLYGSILYGNTNRVPFSGAQIDTVDIARYCAIQSCFDSTRGILVKPDSWEQGVVDTDPLFISTEIPKNDAVWFSSLVNKTYMPGEPALQNAVPYAVPRYDLRMTHRNQPFDMGAIETEL